MYNSELEMEDVTSESPADGQDNTWADIAAQMTNDKTQSPSPCVDAAKSAVASRNNDLNSIQSPDGGNGRAGTKGDASQSQPARGQSPEDQVPKPAGNPVQDLIEIAIPGIAVAKVVAPGAKAAAKAGEKVVEKVAAPAEKVTNEVIKAADDAAKALEEAGKRAAEEFTRKADEARRKIDEAAKRTADDAGKALDLLLGRQKK